MSGVFENLNPYTIGGFDLAGGCYLEGPTLSPVRFASHSDACSIAIVLNTLYQNSLKATGGNQDIPPVIASPLNMVNMVEFGVITRAKDTTDDEWVMKNLCTIHTNPELNNEPSVIRALCKRILDLEEHLTVEKEASKATQRRASPMPTSPDAMFYTGSEPELSVLVAAAPKSTSAKLIQSVRHWHANHAHQVMVARCLKERTDVPIERVRFYDQYVAMSADYEKAASLLRNALSAPESTSLTDMVRTIISNTALTPTQQEYPHAS